MMFTISCIQLIRKFIVFITVVNQESTVAHSCHGKIKFVTAKYNSKQQIQITPGKLQTLTAKTKTIIAIQNSSRQEQNITAKAKHSRQKQNAHGKIKSRMEVSGCPSTWCSASQSTRRRFRVYFSRFIVHNVDT